LQPVEDDLRHLLDELSAAIERTREGHEDRAELTRLVDAVEQRLRGKVAGEEDRHHLVETLEGAALRFEADHPALGGAIRRAVDALSAAGI
jgi:Domain of unknown function (DUF4404)